MSGDEKDVEKDLQVKSTEGEQADAAMGGGTPSSVEEEVDELHERLVKLSRKDRRRTMERLATFYPDEGLGSVERPPDVREKNQGEYSLSFVPKAISDDKYTSSFTTSTSGHRSGSTQNTRSNIVVENNYKKLKIFSSKSKPGSGELDYRHWRRAAVRVVEDEDLSRARKKQLILDSLQGKAEDIVDFSREQSVKDILDLLDCNFKALVDGDDLLADFYQMIQEEKQSASEYLSDLYIELTEIVKEGGTSMGQMQKLLLNQFIRGTRDEEMLTKLRLDEQKYNPPNFPSLMSAVRREECKRTERKLRHKKGSGARSSVVTASRETVAEPADPEVDRLQRRVNKLETMCSKLEAMPFPEEESDELEALPIQPEVAQMQRRLAQLEEKVDKVRSRTIFCYRCGEDGHLATDCSNAPNKSLVLEKVEKRNQRRREYQSRRQNQGN